MSDREEFARAYPEGYFLDPRDREGLERYARSRGFLGREESLLSVGRAGEGNMNLTLRLAGSERSIVLKQSRPWVEKYPAIEAPFERSRVEIAFYEHAAERPELQTAMPRLLGSDAASGVIALEDVGEAQDFTSLYRGALLSDANLERLVAYLAALHRPGSVSAARRGIFANRRMRALNHEHIFRLPLDPGNGLDLDGISPGLAKAARTLQDDERYVARVTELGRLYLQDGESLQHGDYFPGSWLRTGGGIRVIDPEFCFLGTPAFDLGFMLGHLVLAGQPEQLGAQLLDRYGELGEHGGNDLGPLARGFAGVEIMRRLIGVAQLPVDYGAEERRKLLERSRELVLAS